MGLRKNANHMEPLVRIDIRGRYTLVVCFKMLGCVRRRSFEDGHGNIWEIVTSAHVGQHKNVRQMGTSVRGEVRDLYTIGVRFRSYVSCAGEFFRKSSFRPHGGV